MPHSEQMRDYLSFLLWFKDNHPVLNEKYWQNITIPVKDEGVGLMGTDLPETIFMEILQIQHHYYHPPHKDY